VSVRTIDRVVSVQDAEDFARSFAGVGKASAALVWDGGANIVAVTVAPPSGKPLSVDNPLMDRLASAIRLAADPTLRIRVLPYEATIVGLNVKVHVDPDWLTAKVLTSAADACLTALGFNKRELAQPLRINDVTTLVQGVPGVVAVHVEQLDTVYLDEPDPNDWLRRDISASPARWDGSQVLPAQLLVLGETFLYVAEMTEMKP
jgi:hypothetical protein